MPRSSRACVYLFLTPLLVFAVGPIVLEANPTTAPFATIIDQIWDGLMQGLAAMCTIALVASIKWVGQFLRGVNPAEEEEQAELVRVLDEAERGNAQLATPAPIEEEAAPDPDDEEKFSVMSTQRFTGASARPTTLRGALSTCLASTLFITYQLLKSGAVSHDKSLWENSRDAGIFILRGFEILLALLLVLILWWYFKSREHATRSGRDHGETEVEELVVQQVLFDQAAAERDTSAAARESEQVKVEEP